MTKYDLTHEDLIDHWEAWRSLTDFNNSTKLRVIAKERRQKIAKFYAALRRDGVYPLRHSDKHMIFSGAGTKQPIQPEVKMQPDEDCTFASGGCERCAVMRYQEEMTCRRRAKRWMQGIDEILATMPKFNKQLQVWERGNARGMAQSHCRYMNFEFIKGGAARAPVTDETEFDDQF